VQLTNSVIAITGAGRGIGKSIALNCKKQGARVAICARSQAELDEVMKELGPQNCIAVVCDVTRKDQVLNFFSRIKEKLGPLNGLICAAGIYGPIGPFAKTDFSKWEQAIDVNLKGTALSIHTAIPFFDAQRGGHIVLFSGAGQGPLENFSAYATSKGGVWRMNETLGVELAKMNIFMNAIAPGAVNTKLLDDLLAVGPEAVGEATFQKALSQKKEGGTPPDKAADLAVYLLSEKANGLYGKLISAVWDDYQNFTELDKLSKSDIYQVRRVVDNKGGTRA
jgi:NAD(P)-dependent dehydrogenase (short-subunit alcohol dehydrogenase family)